VVRVQPRIIRNRIILDRQRRLVAVLSSVEGMEKPL